MDKELLKPFDAIRPFEPEELPEVFERLLGNAQFAQVVAYVFMQKLNSGNADYAGATAIALMLLTISFVLLFLVTLIQAKASRRTSG